MFDYQSECHCSKTVRAEIALKEELHKWLLEHAGDYGYLYQKSVRVEYNNHMDVREKYYPKACIDDNPFKAGVVDAFEHVYNRTESEEKHLRMVGNDMAHEYLDGEDYSLWLERKAHYGITY